MMKTGMCMNLGYDIDCLDLSSWGKSLNVAPFICAFALACKSVSYCLPFLPENFVFPAG